MPSDPTHRSDAGQQTTSAHRADPAPDGWTPTAPDPTADARPASFGAWDPTAGSPRPAEHGVTTSSGGVRRSRRGRGIASAAGVVVVVVGVAAVASFPFRSGPSQTVTAPFDSITVHTRETPIRIHYEDVATTTITQQGGTPAHRLDGSRLVIEEPERRPAWPPMADRTIDIVLPIGLQGLPPNLDLQTRTGSIDLVGRFGVAALDAGTGSIEAEGDYQRLEVSTRTGSVDARGAAAQVVARTVTGSIDIDTTNTKAVRADSHTGSTEIKVGPEQPELIEVTSRTGSVTVDAPGGAYRIESQGEPVTLGGDVVDDPGAASRISIETTTGQAEVN